MIDFETIVDPRKDRPVGSLSDFFEESVLKLRSNCFRLSNIKKSLNDDILMSSLEEHGGISDKLHISGDVKDLDGLLSTENNFNFNVKFISRIAEAIIIACKANGMFNVNETLIDIKFLYYCSRFSGTSRLLKLLKAFTAWPMSLQQTHVEEPREVQGWNYRYVFGGRFFQFLNGKILNPSCQIGSEKWYNTCLCISESLLRIKRCSQSVNREEVLINLLDHGVDMGIEDDPIEGRDLLEMSVILDFLVERLLPTYVGKDFNFYKMDLEDRMIHVQKNNRKLRIYQTNYVEPTKSASFESSRPQGGAFNGIFNSGITLIENRTRHVDMEIDNIINNIENQRNNDIFDINYLLEVDQRGITWEELLNEQIEVMNGVEENNNQIDMELSRVNESHESNRAEENIRTFFKQLDFRAGLPDLENHIETIMTQVSTTRTELYEEKEFIISKKISQEGINSNKRKTTESRKFFPGYVRSGQTFVEMRKNDISDALGSVLIQDIKDLIADMVVKGEMGDLSILCGLNCDPQLVSLVKCSAIPLCEPFKVRVITCGEEFKYQESKRLQKVLTSAMKHSELNQFFPAINGDITEKSFLQFSDYLKFINLNKSKITANSGDYSRATDTQRSDMTRRVLKSIYRRFPEYKNDPCLQSILEGTLLNHKIEYSHSIKLGEIEDYVVLSEFTVGSSTHEREVIFEIIGEDLELFGVNRVKYIIDGQIENLKIIDYYMLLSRIYQSSAYKHVSEGRHVSTSIYTNEWNLKKELSPSAIQFLNRLAIDTTEQSFTHSINFECFNNEPTIFDIHRCIPLHKSDKNNQNKNKKEIVISQINMEDTQTEKTKKQINRYKNIEFECKWSTYQKRGQVMGSFLSFPLLNIINLAVNMLHSIKSMEYEKFFSFIHEDNYTPVYDSFSGYIDKLVRLDYKGSEDFISIGIPRIVRDSLMRLPMFVNGDDIVQLSSNNIFDGSWSDNIHKYGGYRKSIGKNYVSENFCMINSTLFRIFEDSINGVSMGYQIKQQKCCRIENLYNYEWYSEAGKSKIFHSNKINNSRTMGSMMGPDKVDMKSKHLDYTVNPVLIGELISNFFENCKIPLREVITLFLSKHEEEIKASGRPWFLPCSLGGLGFPCRVENREDWEVDGVLCAYLLRNDKLNIPLISTSKCITKLDRISQEYKEKILKLLGFEKKKYLLTCEQNNLICKFLNKYLPTLDVGSMLFLNKLYLEESNSYQSCTVPEKKMYRQKNVKPLIAKAHACAKRRKTNLNSVNLAKNSVYEYYVDPLVKFRIEEMFIEELEACEVTDDEDLYEFASI